MTTEPPRQTPKSLSSLLKRKPDQPPAPKPQAGTVRMSIRPVQKPKEQAISLPSAFEDDDEADEASKIESEKLLEVDGATSTPEKAMLKRKPVEQDADEHSDPPTSPRHTEEPKRSKSPAPSPRKSQEEPRKSQEEPRKGFTVSGSLRKQKQAENDEEPKEDNAPPPPPNKPDAMDTEEDGHTDDDDDDKPKKKEKGPARATEEDDEDDAGHTDDEDSKKEDHSNDPVALANLDNKTRKLVGPCINPKYYRVIHAGKPLPKSAIKDPSKITHENLWILLLNPKYLDALIDEWMKSNNKKTRPTVPSEMVEGNIEIYAVMPFRCDRLRHLKPTTTPFVRLFCDKPGEIDFIKNLKLNKYNAKEVPITMDSTFISTALRDWSVVKQFEPKSHEIEGSNGYVVDCRGERIVFDEAKEKASQKKTAKAEAAKKRKRAETEDEAEEEEKPKKTKKAPAKPKKAPPKPEESEDEEPPKKRKKPSKLDSDNEEDDGEYGEMLSAVMNINEAATTGNVPRTRPSPKKKAAAAPRSESHEASDFFKQRSMMMVHNIIDEYAARMKKEITKQMFGGE